MAPKSATIECPMYAGPIACLIRVRYADAPGALTRIDFAAGGPDCHLVQVQPSRDGRSMEVHFTGCRHMMAGLLQALDVCDIEGESQLLSPFCGEYRQAGLVVGTIREFLGESALLARLERTGRPVELVRKRPARASAPAAGHLVF
jgi:hypothetical protein